MYSFFAPTTKMIEHQREEIASAARPRVVTVSWKLIRKWALLLAVCAVFALPILAAIRKSRVPGSYSLDVLLPACVGLFMTGYSAHAFRGDVHDRRLLMNGVCSAGKVISQELIGTKTKKSEIRYEFHDTVGDRWEGKGTDLTFEYLIDAPVAVFYLLENPAKNVAYCCTGWRVRTKAGYLLEP